MPGSLVNKKFRYVRTLSPHEVAVLEWAIACLGDTVASLSGKWDSEGSRKNCETASEAVAIMHRLMERLK
jgi:hypothetical protein